MKNPMKVEPEFMNEVPLKKYIKETYKISDENMRILTELIDIKSEFTICLDISLWYQVHKMLKEHKTFDECYIYVKDYVYMNNMEDHL